MPDVVEVFDNMPGFSRFYVIGSAVLGLLVFMGLVGGSSIFVGIPQDLWKPKFILSLLFNGKMSLNLLLDLYFFSITCGRMEQQYRPNKYGEFFYMILFLVILTYIIEIAINWNGYALLATCFKMALTYIFCKRNPNERMMLFFVFTIKAAYLPFGLLVIDLLQGGSIWSLVAGIAVGHAYVFLKDILPVSHKKDPLATPLWAIRFVNWIKNSNLPYVGRGGVAQAFGRDAEGNRPFAGQGVRIG